MSYYQKITDSLSIKRVRSILIFSGIGIPIFIAILALLTKFDEIRWLFTDTGDLSTTDGKIIASSIKYQHGVKSDDWVYDISYEYTVNSKTYVSDRVNYEYKDSDDARMYTQKYPINRTVVVYYDSIYPEKSVLEPDIKNYGSVYFFLIFLCIGIILVLWGIYFNQVNLFLEAHRY